MDFPSISAAHPEALEIPREKRGILADPESESSSQPEYVRSATRAHSPGKSGTVFDSNP